MKTKIETKLQSLIQSIRFANPEAKGESISHLITESLNDNSEFNDDYVKFSVYADIKCDVSDLPGDGLRDVEVNDDVLLKSDSIFELVLSKWVITEGQFEGKGFDLTDVTSGKSNMYFGSVMSQIISLLNKSTGLDVWVEGDKRGKLKDFVGEVTFLLLQCEVPRANLRKGIAHLHLVTVNFGKSSFNASPKGTVHIEQDIERFKYELAMAIFNDEKTMHDWKELNNKSHERSAPSRDLPEL